MYPYVLNYFIILFLHPYFVTVNLNLLTSAGSQTAFKRWHYLSNVAFYSNTVVHLLWLQKTKHNRRSFFTSSVKYTHLQVWCWAFHHERILKNEIALSEWIEISTLNLEYVYDTGQTLISCCLSVRVLQNYRCREYCCAMQKSDLLLYFIPWTCHDPLER